MKFFLFAISVLTFSANGISLQQMIDEAGAQKKEILSIPQNVYRLNDQLKLRNLKNFTLDGNGSTLLMTNYSPTMRIERCENLTLRNFKIDYDPLPHTQGTVLAVDRKNKLTRIRLHQGYPVPSRQTGLSMYPFSSQTRRFKEGVNEHFNSRLIPLGTPNEFNLWTHEYPDGIEPGDFVALRFGKYPCFWIRLCHNLTVDSVTVHAASTLVFVARSNTGVHRYKNVRILPGKTLPAGATEPRLLSAGADGINYENSPARIELENCEFGFLGDDSMNIHGTALPAYLRVNERTIRIIAPEDYRFLLKPGMTMRLMKPGNFTIFAELPIAEIRWLNQKAPEETKKLFPRTMSIPPCRELYEITVQDPLPEIAPGTILDFREMNGLSFSVKKCYFHDQRAYGLRMMCSNGIIESNRFERIKGSAIVFGGEYAYWREAGHVENLTIRNNVIDRTANYPANVSFAAIATIGRPEKRKIGVSKNGSRNIRIEENVISNSPFGAIQLFGVRNVSVKGNLLVNIGTTNVFPRAATLGFQKLTPIALGYSVTECDIRDNQIRQTQKEEKK